ncbi:MAG: hypothetical protein WKF81_08975 [Thermomicrobiales bacterium]
MSEIELYGDAVFGPAFIVEASPVDVATAKVIEEAVDEDIQTEKIIEEPPVEEPVEDDETLPTEDTELDETG